jgi:PD-(D/E)XK nuclease superfamily
MAEYIKKYNPNRSAEWNYGGDKWKLSRSKIEFFVECPRCFYLDNKLGTKRPGMPAFNLNIAVDELCKKEFDTYRQSGTPHPIAVKYNVDAVPFNHPDLATWRDTFAGIEYRDEATGLLVSGAVDDIWQTPSGELLVIDYKATSKEGEILTLDDSSWGAQYARQMGVYQWLLRKNGFTVSDTGYFVYANASKEPAGFFDTLEFKTTLVPCVGDTSWIPDTLVAIKRTLDDTMYPDSGAQCEYCPYREACGRKLIAIKQTKS